MNRWLTILGIGADGVEGLSANARSALAGAECVIGGRRHLESLDERISGERLPWPQPFSDAVGWVRQRQGRRVVVLASGDPFEYGVATQLTESFSMQEMLCIPSPSAFSLACSRLGWTRQKTKTLSFCGRPIAPLVRALQPGQRILALSADAATPAEVAQCLRDRGFGGSLFYVLECIGGAQERITRTVAADFGDLNVLPLNVIGIEVQADSGAKIIPLACGLDDTLFEHDGQITKREIRAITLSALTPRAGELLWDVGCGSGSVAIEWLMRHDENKAIAIEAKKERAQRAARNALALGTPDLVVIEGEAPQAFANLPTPDAIFIGGGAHVSGLIEKAWQALRPGGRLVANAVVIETEVALVEAQRKLGGLLSRLSIERLDSIGRFHSFRPAMTVTQWRAEKS
jgi:precorrin-6Y C5,15-methyltransferase (decarboxylating)